jgi:EAL domain-containing protein (putative c-di-GMP-specific phosphodiesterase class I)
MDDFGTGHSSLSCLHRFPIDVLKIDRAFADTLGSSRDYAAVVQAIVTLAHNLNVRVVAEGVETPQHMVQLQALDCDFAQGYHFSKPIPAALALSLISDGPRWTQRAA